MNVQLVIGTRHQGILAKRLKSKPISLLELASDECYFLFLENILIENHSHILCNATLWIIKSALQAEELVSVESSPSMRPVGILRIWLV